MSKFPTFLIPLAVLTVDFYYGLCLSLSLGGAVFISLAFGALFILAVLVGHIGKSEPVSLLTRVGAWLTLVFPVALVSAHIMMVGSHSSTSGLVFLLMGLYAHLAYIILLPLVYVPLRLYRHSKSNNLQ